MEIRDTRYARAPDGTYLAYLVVGEGPIDIAWQTDWWSNVDLLWVLPWFREWIDGLASFSRVILHDRRGVGLSSRTMPGDLETRVADLRTVLAAVGSERPVLAGALDGGAPNALMAATHPDAVRAVVWWQPSARSLWAPDHPWGVSQAYVESDLEGITQHWGTAEYGDAFVRTEALADHTVSAEDARFVAFMSRHTCTPDMALELSRIWYDTDLRAILPTIQVPTLLMSSTVTGPDLEGEADYVARSIPGSVHVRIDDPERTRDWTPAFDAIRSFVGVERPPVGLDTVLATVLFTDIVGSTGRQAELGDRAWKSVLERHHQVVRHGLERWRGAERDTAGDGFFATFDGPARAVRCALEVVDQVRELGLEIRAGVHTGECEIVDRKVGGLAVSIGARVATTARPSEVLVSQTVRDLVAGSGLVFEDAGEHELKGVPERWRLYRVIA